MQKQPMVMEIRSPVVLNYVGLAVFPAFVASLYNIVKAMPDFTDDMGFTVISTGDHLSAILLFFGGFFYVLKRRWTSATLLSAFVVFGITPLLKVVSLGERFSFDEHYRFVGEIILSIVMVALLVKCRRLEAVAEEVRDQENASDGETRR